MFQERRIAYQPPPQVSRDDGYYERERRAGGADSSASRAGSTASRAPSAQSAPAPESSYGEGLADKSRSMDAPLGTGHGEREWSSARSTQFVRATHSPAELNAIWYDSRRNLMASGIIPHPQRRYADRGDSRPFPGFVPDPW